jgi:hypothetical protein
MGPLILILWLLAQSHPRRSPADSPARSGAEKTNAIAAASPVHIPIQLPDVTPTPYPGQMSMFSAYAGSRPKAPNSELQVRCKTDRSVSNVDARVPISGVVQEDVVSLAGNILVPAGAKVFGQGFCDAEHARLLGRGSWNFYLSDHQVRVQGTLWDMARVEGLPGDEISGGLEESRVKQAIYRDGIYLYVPSGTEFTLRLSGEVSVEDLPSAFGK